MSSKDLIFDMSKISAVESTAMACHLSGDSLCFKDHSDLERSLLLIFDSTINWIGCEIIDDEECIRYEIILMFASRKTKYSISQLCETLSRTVGADFEVDAYPERTGWGIYVYAFVGDRIRYILDSCGSRSMRNWFGPLCLSLGFVNNPALVLPEANDEDLLSPSTTLVNGSDYGDLTGLLDVATSSATVSDDIIFGQTINEEFVEVETSFGGIDPVLTLLKDDADMSSWQRPYCETEGSSSFDGINSVDFDVSMFESDC